MSIVRQLHSDACRMGRSISTITFPAGTSGRRGRQHEYRVFVDDEFVGPH